MQSILRQFSTSNAWKGTSAYDTALPTDNNEVCLISTILLGFLYTHPQKLTNDYTLAARIKTRCNH